MVPILGNFGLWVSGPWGVALDPNPKTLTFEKLSCVAEAELDDEACACVSKSRGFFKNGGRARVYLDPKSR